MNSKIFKTVFMTFIYEDLLCTRCDKLNPQLKSLTSHTCIVNKYYKIKTF